MVSRGVLDNIANRANQQRGQLVTEEATKTALVLPFLQALGYDIFNPSEVVPEYTADYGLKANEKVDYALIKDGSPVILIECKRIGDPLDVSRASQLARYFAMSDAKIGILTDGVIYKFFSDLDADNTMDAVPFLEIDVTAVVDRELQKLAHFSKQTFDLEAVRAMASELRYVKGMKEYLAQVYHHPDEDLVRLLARRVFGGVLNQNRMEHFTQLSRIAFREFVNDLTADTFRRASSIVTGESADAPEEAEDEPADNAEEGARGIETTIEEIRGYELVKSVVSEVIDQERVTFRDGKNYCSITIDGKTMSVFARMRFNNPSNKRLSILGPGEDPDSRRSESTHKIDDVNDIADYGTELREAVRLVLPDTPDK